MELIFRCERCGKRFCIDGQYQGRKGRCKDCGQIMTIPTVAVVLPEERQGAEEPTRPIPAVAPAEEPLFSLSPPERSPRVYRREPPSEIDVVQAAPGAQPRAAIATPLAIEHQPSSDSGYGIELVDDDEDVRAALPVSPQIERGLREMAEFARDPHGYSLDMSRAPRAFLWFGRRGESGPASWLIVKWRAAISGILRLLRWIDTWAYLISVPFLILLAFGIVMENTPLAHAGAVVVVLVNYGRFWTDLLALFVRPFKQSPLHGLAFLFPPYGLYFIATHWKQMKPTLRRMATSCIPIVLVVLAYAFSPLINPGVEKVEGVGAKLEAGEKQLVRDIDEGVRKIRGRLPSLETVPKIRR
jgi:hypothetical protein